MATKGGPRPGAARSGSAGQAPARVGLVRPHLGHQLVHRVESALLAQAGFRHAYNVLEGFEGDHGLGANGWRAAGLPWKKG